MRYRHRRTGQLYAGRSGHNFSDSPDIQQGWEHLGVLDERMSVFALDERGYARHSVWVSLSQLEPLVQENASTPEDFDILATEPAKDPEDLAKENEKARIEQQRVEERNAKVLSIAEEMSFNLGNALLALVDGDLMIAHQAILQEIRRVYGVADPVSSSEEPHRE